MQSMMHKSTEACAGLGYLWFFCTLRTCHRLPRLVGPQADQGNSKMGRAKLTISPRYPDAQTIEAMFVPKFISLDMFFCKCF